MARWRIGFGAAILMGSFLLTTVPAEAQPGALADTWFQLRMTGKGLCAGTGATRVARESFNVNAYLHLGSWDTPSQTYVAQFFWQDGSGVWHPVPCLFLLVSFANAPPRLDMLVSSLINLGEGELKTAFSARIAIKEKNGNLSARFTSIGSAYYSPDCAGTFKLKGKMVSGPPPELP